jgi:hypothetical protein
MKNTDALECMLVICQEFMKHKNSTDLERRRLFADRLIAWALVRQLAPVAEVVAKAWLELSPDSLEAREVLVSHLYTAGRPGEAARIENGGEPEMVDELSEDNLSWSRANAQRSADYRDE